MSTPVLVLWEGREVNQGEGASTDGPEETLRDGPEETLTLPEGTSV